MKVAGTGDLWMENYALRELPAWLGDGRLDAAMLIAPAGAPKVSEVVLHGRSSLLPLDLRTLRGLRSKAGESHPFLRHIAFGSIPSGTYVYQGKELSTLAVPILLLAHAGTSPRLATTVRDTARQEWDLIGADSRRRPGWQVPAASLKAEPLARSGLKLLSGLEREDPAPDRFRIAQYLVLTSAAVVAVLVAFTLRRRVRDLWRHYPRLCKIVLPLVAAMPVITGLTHYAERDINENFSSFWESWWSITVYIFSGLEDRVPYTPHGRILVMLGLALGAVCSAVFTGWTAAAFIRREKSMPARLKDHCLLLNWNERGIDVIRELHHPVLRQHGRTSTIVMLKESAARSPIIPVGVQRASAGKVQVFTNPRTGTEEATLRKDDKLVLIAYGPPGMPLPKPDRGAAIAPVPLDHGLESNARLIGKTGA